jgi:hypothetical protein
MTVYKVDGIGTRKDGSGGEVVNKGSAEGFIRLMLKPGESCARGDVMAFDFAATEPALGYGNHCIKATATALSDACIGIATEAVTVGASEEDKPVLIQVAGLCDFATINTGSATDGAFGIADANSDVVDVGASTVTPYLCAIVKKASGIVYLLNPYNL